MATTVDAPDASPGDGICADSSGQCTLRAAIQEADAQPQGSSVSIAVPAGTYAITLGTLVLSANSISISGALSSTTIISGTNTGTVMSISSTVQATLSQLTIMGGNAGTNGANGGGIDNAGVATLSQSAVVSNTTGDGNGSGIFNAGTGRLSLVNSTVADNSGLGGGTQGGGIANSGILTVTNSDLSDNTVGSMGGAIYNSGTLTVAQSSLDGNTAISEGGGGIFNAAGSVLVSDSSLDGNGTEWSWGGGIWNNGGILTVTNSTVSGSFARYDGGGIYNLNGTATVTGSSLVSNSSADGSGIANTGLLTVTNSTFTDNAVSLLSGQNGGGIWNSGGALTVTNSTFSGNSALYGGGIYNTGTLSVTNGTLSGNSLLSYGLGGGIYNTGTATLLGTIVANTSGAGGSVAGNCYGTISSRGYNLDDGTTCGFNQTTDLTNTNPLLGQLTNNGGPAQTMALLPGSPAIDRGETVANGCPPTDQRGMPRPDEAGDNGACDIGAYESVTTGTWTASGNMNVARYGQTATLLPNGKVLVAGGDCCSTAELYDPATATWAPTGSMSGPRRYHTATLLANGQVLVAGEGTSELYDPTTGAWTPSGAMNAYRIYDTAVLLPGGKVLVAGGFDGMGHELASAELYDPSTGLWTPTGSMHYARDLYAAALLPNGTVLVAGGCCDDPATGFAEMTEAEIYDPSTGTWSTTTSMSYGRQGPTGTLLPNGKVLVAGGGGSMGELYDPATGTWSATGNLGTFSPFYHTATLLPTGQVLIAGDQIDPYYASSELYDPATNMWVFGNSMNVGRFNHTATLLPNGQVLVAGGQNAGGEALTSAELYTPGPFFGLSTGTMDFGAQVVGSTSVTQTLTFTNTSTLTATIASITITGTNAGDFAETNGCAGLPLAPNTSCVVDVGFTPTATGSRTAILSLVDDAAGSPQSVSLTGTGTSAGVSLAPSNLTFVPQPLSTRSATQTITLTNGGTAPLTISSIAVAGANAADFTETDSCSTAAIPVNGSCAINVSFTPAETGSRSASLSIVDNALDSPQSVLLAGTGINPIAGLLPSSLNFGTQQVGTRSGTQLVNILNSGSTPLDVSSVTLSGANPGDFAETDTCAGASVAPQTSCGIVVSFAPSAAGSRSASLSIADNAPGSPHIVLLAGTGVLPLSVPATSTPTNTPAPPTATPVSAAPATATPTSAVPAAATPTPATPMSAPATKTLAPPAATATATHVAGTAHQTLHLTVKRAAHVVVGGQMLTISLTSAAHAQVTLTLRVIATKVVVTGKGKHRKRVTRTHVLYHASIRGTTDAHGRYTGHLHVAYRPAKPVRAQVLVSVHKGRLTTTHILAVMIQPLGRHK